MHTSKIKKGIPQSSNRIWGLNFNSNAEDGHPRDTWETEKGGIVACAFLKRKENSIPLGHLEGHHLKWMQQSPDCTCRPLIKGSSSVYYRAEPWIWRLLGPSLDLVGSREERLSPQFGEFA